jgi:hypothetical protein
MSSSRPPLSPEVRALLAQERVVSAVPASVRARALARARAALLAGRITAPSDFGRAPRRHWGASVAGACVAIASVAAAAHEIRVHFRPAAHDQRIESHARAVAAPPAAPAPAPSTSVAPPPAPALATPAHSPPAAPGPDELRLLRQARAAVARQDFTSALRPIAEHARRFKEGRLAEEREALRVRALSGLGRSEEARRAASAFEARFPRSVLLPAVRQMSGPRP